MSTNLNPGFLRDSRQSLFTPRLNIRNVPFLYDNYCGAAEKFFKELI